MQEQTMFSHVVGPPRSRGMTWSRFRSFRSTRLAAVLAGVLVPLENVVARELDFLLRQPVVDEQQDDARHADAEGNGADRFRVRLLLGEVAPFVEIKGLERAVVAVEHDLGVALEQQRQRAAGGADVDRLPQPVQHQHMLVEHRTHIRSNCAPSYTNRAGLSTRACGPRRGLAGAG